MLKRYDEAELLALIEDELDPADAQRLRRRLAEDPQSLALIERLREDPARLRATPEPEAPGDLLAELEPILARPMLMPRMPARRRRRRPVLPVVAATVAVAGLGALWATLVAVVGPAAPEAIELADARTSLPPVPVVRAEPGPAPQPVAAGETTWPPPGTVVHHYEPLPAEPGRPAVPGEPGRGGRAARGAEPVLVAANFILVVRAADPTGAEQVLQRAVGDLGGETALVRNFSYREADALGETMRLAEGARRAVETGADDIVADAADGTAARQPAERQPAGRRRPFPRPQDRPEARLSTSALIAGSAELAPSFERQLEFSDRGTAYTLSVPADRLAQVLTRLVLDEAQQTALRTGAGEPGDGVTDELRWLRDWPQVRQAATAMDRHGPDAVILLPVVVEEP